MDNIYRMILTDNPPYKDKCSLRYDYNNVITLPSGGHYMWEFSTDNYINSARAWFTWDNLNLRFVYDRQERKLHIEGPSSELVHFLSKTVCQ